VDAPQQPSKMVPFVLIADRGGEFQRWSVALR
jgi:hypothetical protein